MREEQKSIKQTANIQQKKKIEKISLKILIKVINHQKYIARNKKKKKEGTNNIRIVKWNIIIDPMEIFRKH